MLEIRISWDGPYSLKDIGYLEENGKYEKKNVLLNDKKKDYGVYQIYGFHPVYGSNVLLYIGKAPQQTFAKRIAQEGWEYNEDHKNLQIYVGRLFGNEDELIDSEKWESMIDIAEKMLIYTHAPAKNSSNILNISKKDHKLKEFENVRIFNYDCCRSLAPEISGDLWIKEFDYKGVFQKEL